MKYYKLLLILFAFTSCDVSTISEKDTQNISKLKVNIYIKDENKEELLSEIKVNLTDGKKQIINDKIKVLLNGKPLKLFVRTGNYYDKHSSYSTDDLLRNESYYFEIILPDSTKYPLAFLKPLKRSDSAQFYFPKNKKEIKKDTIGNYSATKIKEIINTKNGKYTIPKSFLKDSLTTVNYIKVRLNKQEIGLINPKLMINSSITYDYTIEERIDVKEK